VNNNQKLDLTEVLYTNGINGSTGEYLTPSMTGEELARLISDESPEADVEYYATLEEKSGHEEPTYGLRFGLDSRKLDETGWGVIYAPGISDEAKEALEPLIGWRKAQAGPLFREYAYQGEMSRDFLFDHDTSIAGPADPEEMPYYLLLVGGPEEIAYSFQYEMDVDRALGRIHFEGAEEYHNYAQSVVSAEKGEVCRPRQAAFFGVANPGDGATRLSTDLLIEPLFEGFKARLEGGDPGWEVVPYLRDDATRAQLERLLGADEDQTPAFLITASHGMAFNPDDPRLLAHQGALLCQDWNGQAGSLGEDVYLASEHVADDARLHGLISFFFACYGAGTPREDEFMGIVEGQPKRIAPQPFVARLPQRLLSHPRGGALAVIGHIERAWTYSFNWPGKRSAHLGVFESTLGMLFEDYPIGAAFDYFNERHASASVQLNALLENKRKKLKVSDVDLVRMWTVNNDARDYIILGDPAVRLCVPRSAQEAVKPSAIG
jgi:hypothetical protein